MDDSFATTLNKQQTQKGLQQVIKDGLATEAMSCLTEGTFLVALALQLGATNFQVGLLAALPTFTNIFQLSAIWLVQHFNSRKTITVTANLLARLPLFAVGLLPFFFTKGAALHILILLMLTHYFFGSIAGASWNAWMKDLVPQNALGSYFAKRTRLTQMLNISLSVVLALILDYIKAHYPSLIPATYPILFIAGGITGMMSVYALSKAPEPKPQPVKSNLFGLFVKALRDINFRKLLVFNATWVFALNLASPFFSVYMMKTMGIPVSHILALNILAQLSSILFVKLWGKYSDRYSNKNIISLSIPVYILCLLAWMFTASMHGAILFATLVCIHMLTGIATSGINLGLNNIGLKLSPSKDAIVYLATKNVITAFFSAAAPLLGGLMADFFATHPLRWNVEWHGTTVHLLHMQQWSFFFIVAAILATISLQLLRQVGEIGEVNRFEVIRGMRIQFRHVRVRAIHASAVRIKAMWPPAWKQKDDEQKRA